MSIKVAYFGSGLAGKTTLKHLKKRRNIHLIKIYSADTFSTWNEVDQFLSDQEIDVVVVCSFGKMVPKDSLVIPKYGWWNVHYSLLPKYRGAVPIQAALLAGEKKVGVTVFKMVEALDAGEILSQESIVVEEADDAKSLILKSSETAAKLICEDLPRYISKDIKLASQKGTPTYCYALLTAKNNRKIDWSNSRNEVLSKIKAFVVNGGAFTTLNNREIKILRAEKAAICAKGLPGTLIRKKPCTYVKCLRKWLQLNEVLVTGKNKMSGADFGNGYIKGKARFD